MIAATIAELPFTWPRSCCRTRGAASQSEVMSSHTFLEKFQHRSWSYAAPITHTSPATRELLAYRGLGLVRIRARLGADRGKRFLNVYPARHAVAPPWTSGSRRDALFVVGSGVALRPLLRGFEDDLNVSDTHTHIHRHACWCQRLRTCTVNIQLHLVEDLSATLGTNFSHVGFGCGFGLGF